ncbi:MAG: N-acetyl-gamma-glutamyl-phosphate reductase [Alicyclobacillus macrosporangiidus]|uniref:N-acetyl-gamma-glutamyl-phosphate reductase n=1 Tax=Alicyclobacillus macrosporangiidus TaxID=392015 RepID=UPI0026F0C1D0|nr:N-acetyl-gamma-glutamyl-phosphate reductase [Alicyclobacillus macrosporangiidus]MCL6598625.1 N-acetyl-gamma-glutamyl-phosphate reductase [Alicyclobacillus macrosporangiidus]
MTTPHTTRIRAGVVGATGYGGLELVRLLAAHPGVELTYLAGSKEGGPDFTAWFPHLAGIIEAPLHTFDPAACTEQCDAVFVALPSGVSGQVAAQLWERGRRVIDLSGDLRVPADLYHAWYKRDPVDPAVQAQAVYGLPEWHRERIAKATLVANPGCYATAILLGLLPLAAAGWLNPARPVLVDAKSGVTGAGRTPTLTTHLGELYENFFPYKVGAHQHTPEIEQELGRYAEAKVLMTTQLLPVARGIYVVSYVTLDRAADVAQVCEVYREAYEHAPFVRVHAPGHVPQMKHVRGSNFCDIGLFVDERTGVLQVFSVIDNLTKGAAGQAVQNFNLMHGLPEEMGLTGGPMFP